MLIAAGMLVLLSLGSSEGEKHESPRSRYAIVIGQNRPEDPTESPLRYADDDALATHQLLLEAGVRSVLLVRLDDDSRRLHPGADPSGAPTVDNIFRQFDAVAQQIAREKEQGREAELLFYYSGHGNVQNGEGYVVVDDGRLTRRDLFEKLLERSQAAVNHVIVDACRSYFLVFEKGPGGRRQPVPPSFLGPLRPRSNVGFVLSTSSDRESHEWARYQAGVFSHEVRSALRGGADANGDGRITYGELGAFIARANHAIPNAEFRPDAVVIPPGGALKDFSAAVLSWKEPQNKLAVAGVHGLGHFYLENVDGTRILDAHPGAGQSITLRLPAERPLFLRTADGNKEYPITGSAGQLAMIRPRPSSSSPKGALSIAFKRLFEEPFGQGEVVSFERDQAPSVDGVVATQRTTSEPTFLGGVRRAAPWVAAGSAVLGGAITVAALLERNAAGQANQSDRDGINQTIRGLNTAAVVSYSTAVVALATWAVLSFSTDERGPE